MIDEIRVIKKCPRCGKRLCDVLAGASGYVEMKCPNCRQIVKIRLELRRKASCRITTTYYEPSA